MLRVYMHTAESAIASEKFAEWLRTQRIAKKESQELLANSLDVDRKAIMSYESGRSTPRLDVLAKLYAHFGENEIRIPLR